MHKYIFLVILEAFVVLHANEKLFECTEIFRERKSELLIELERIDEQKQALHALQIATEELLGKKEQRLNHKEQEIDEKVAIVSEKEMRIEKLLKENEAILKEIKEIKMSALSQTFAKMKPAAASQILSEMPEEEAVAILRSLKPNIVGQIFAKMQTKKASELTSLLTK
ncbi:MAG: PDP protein [Sulfurimonadaceae bacterium]|nr:PDP protein [Sulfurimonadaceae bacterium]